jgi:hypothetical protein
LPGEGSDRVQPRPLRWNADSQDFAGARLFALYKKLIRIRKEHASLRSGNFFPFPFNHPDGYGSFPEKDVVIFHRYGPAADGQVERFIIAINYSDFDKFIDVPFSVNGHWDDLLNEQSAVVENFRLFNQRIHSNWGWIYFKKG